MQSAMARMEQIEHSANVRQLTEYLLNNRHLAQSVLSLIELGAFSDQTRQAMHRTTSCRKWKQLSCAALKNILKRAFPDHAEQIDGLKPKRRMLLQTMLYLFHIDLGDFYHPDNSDLLQRHASRGFGDLHIHDGEPDWSRAGVFRVQCVNSVNYLYHNDSGLRVKLPDLLQDQHVMMDASTNYSADKAMVLGADSIEVKCSELFLLDKNDSDSDDDDSDSD